ncbi:CBS domain-containing protein [Pseudorhodoferax sp.]|uniref:CBS domain-containing protein n=1 Tax=Pseudorhodoferax sp. TaxID=1993553 RepID=UPI0039E6EAD1
MQARDVMTRQVISVAPDASLREVVDLLLAHRISGMPVVERGTVVGLVGVGELMHRHEIGTDDPGAERSWWQRLLVGDPSAASYVRSHGTHVRDVMTQEVVGVPEDAPLARLAQIFEQRRIRRVPVLRDGRMVGLVTRADLVRALARACTPSAPALDDAQICQRLARELERQSWWDGTWSTFQVSGGVVRFAGYVQRQADKDAARIAAENIPGVRAVEDERALYGELQPLL